MDVKSQVVTLNHELSEKMGEYKGGVTVNINVYGGVEVEFLIIDNRYSSSQSGLSFL